MFKQLIISLAFVTLFGVFAVAQEHPATDKDKKEECIKDSKDCCKKDGMASNMEMNKDGKHHMKMENHNNMKMNKEQKGDASIIREGVIDLQVIDENKDGKVFQDMMDWNVISDKPGDCSLCGMTLKAYTLNEAKTNLVKHGYKIIEK